MASQAIPSTDPSQLVAALREAQQAFGKTLEELRVMASQLEAKRAEALRLLAQATALRTQLHTDARTGSTP